MSSFKVLMKFVKQNVTYFLDRNSGTDGGDNRYLVRIVNGIICVIIIFCFAAHLTLVVYEYSTFKYVDTTAFNGIDSFLPDIAICRQRNVEVRPFHMLVHWLILHHNYKIKGGGKTIRSLSRREDVKKMFRKMRRRIRHLMHVNFGKRHFLRYYHLFNLTASDAELVPNLQDNLIKCQSMGHPCSAEDFTLPNQLDSTSSQCIIFKTRRFMKKVKSFNDSIPEDVREELLSVVMRWKWKDVKPSSDETVETSLIEKPIDIRLLMTDAAPLFKSNRRSSGTLLYQQQRKSGQWLDIIFDMEVKKRLFCNSESQKEIHIRNRINRQSLKFTYTPLLCRRKFNQQKTLKRCGCVSAQLPLPDYLSTVDECISIPAVFDQAHRASFASSDGSVTLYDNHENVLGIFGRNSDFVARAHCALPMIATEFHEIPECTDPCQEVSANADSVHRRTLSNDIIESQFSNDDNVSHIRNDDLSHLFGFQVRPANWKVPVTSQQEVYPLSKLLSDFGGLIGLWLGVSALSILNVHTVIYRYRRG